jgi:putative tryptophan/tyrosine transport system substrate-binding protein
MKRRDLITLIGGAGATLPLAWSLAARAQHGSRPVIGFLRNTDAESSESLVSAFRRGLSESGFIDGQNVAIEYRWANNHDDRLPALAADLVKKQVALIFAGGGSVVALAAKEATQTIPIVFELGGDPVKMGLVGSLNHPGANLTGVALFANVIGAKRVELLHDFTPNAKTIGLLVEPVNPSAKHEIQLAHDAAASLGMRVNVLQARSQDEIDSAFSGLRQSNIGGLIVMATPLFVANRERLVSLAAQHGIPTIYPFRSFANAGGLMSYGDDLNDAFRQAGIYAGRILKGEAAGDLPVVQSTKFELVINLKTAKALGLSVPSSLIAIADDVIE